MNVSTVRNADHGCSIIKRQIRLPPCHMFARGKDSGVEALDLKEKHNWELCRCVWNCVERKDSWLSDMTFHPKQTKAHLNSTWVQGISGRQRQGAWGGNSFQQEPFSDSSSYPALSGSPDITTNAQTHGAWIQIRRGRKLLLDCGFSHLKWHVWV